MLTYADVCLQVVPRNSSIHEFVLLATDGLWDVVSSQEAVDMVASCTSS